MTEITKPILFAVEGRDEENFFDVYLKFLGFENYEIRAVLGKDNFKKQLETLINSRGFSAVNKLVLIRDADENSENAFISLQKTLKDLKLPVPKKEGELITENGFTCAIYIMPTYPERGMIEDLCLQSIEQTNNYSCINKFIECIDITPKNIAKTKAQIYLSIQNPIVNSLGIGAQKGYWDLKHTCFEKLKQFILKLKNTK